MAAWSLVFCPAKRRQRLIVVRRRCCFLMQPQDSHCRCGLRNAAQLHSDANSGNSFVFVFCFFYCQPGALITWQRWGLVITLKAHEHGRQTDTTQLSLLIRSTSDCVSREHTDRRHCIKRPDLPILLLFYLAFTGSFHLSRNENKLSSPNFNIWIPLILILHRLIKIPLLWITALITGGLALTNCRSFLPTIWSTSPAVVKFVRSSVLLYCNVGFEQIFYLIKAITVKKREREWDDKVFNHLCFSIKVICTLWQTLLLLTIE